MKTKIILILVLLVLAAVVFIQNTEEVTYKIYFWKVSVSQMILLPLTLLVGFFIGFFAAGMRRRRS